MVESSLRRFGRVDIKAYCDFWFRFDFKLSGMSPNTQESLHPWTTSTCTTPIFWVMTMWTCQYKVFRESNQAGEPSLALSIISAVVQPWALYCLPIACSYRRSYRTKRPILYNRYRIEMSDKIPGTPQMLEPHWDWYRPESHCSFQTWTGFIGKSGNMVSIFIKLSYFGDYSWNQDKTQPIS